MSKNFLLVSGFIVLLIIVFFASFFGFPGRWISSRQKRIVLQQSIVYSQPPTLTPTPTINWQSIQVPEPSETPTDKDTAVPKYTYGTNFGGIIRFFEISVNQDAFTPRKVIVYQGDMVRIYLTSIDKTYDMTVSDYGNSMNVSVGESKLLEFQAAIPGQFSLTCSLCNQGKTAFESKGPRGVLLVKPRS